MNQTKAIVKSVCAGILVFAIVISIFVGMNAISNKDQPEYEPETYTVYLTNATERQILDTYSNLHYSVSYGHTPTYVYVSTGDVYGNFHIDKRTQWIYGYKIDTATGVNLDTHESLVYKQGGDDPFISINGYKATIVVYSK